MLQLIDVMAGTPTTSVPPRADGRRELGERTRQRLLEAARELLAERGEDAIRLRDVTEAAQVNVAAVNYHFGSLRALFTEAIKDAVVRIQSEILAALDALGEDAGVEAIAAAWVRPSIAARCGQCREARAFIRIAARAASSPPEGMCDWMRETVARTHEELVSHLRQALPGVGDDELRFRISCAAGILQALRSDAMQAEVERRSPAELEAYLVPVVSGVLGAGAPVPALTPQR